MDKKILVEQIRSQLQQASRIACMATEDAAAEAMNGATPGEKTLDARVAIEYGQMAKAQARRAQAVAGELAQLESFHPGPARRAVDIGAVVEVEDDESGEGRTFFLAPVGAGLTLTGPGGDGVLSVVTPASPIGKAVLGRKTGDVVDVTVKGNVREWLITYVG
ncbi:MAG TPA: GreA/GreB family elongation factor [Kofleriaceae bacterium]|nr:GreA/GreB family elongation factor [Kofleriaceae bacterium]